MNKPDLTIFLDVDGVFVGACEGRAKYVTAMRDPNITLEERTAIRKEVYVNLRYTQRDNPDVWGDPLNHLNVFYLNRLQEYFNCEVVLSSSWRKGIDMHKLEAMQYLLDQAGIKMQVVGKTNHSFKKSLLRKIFKRHHWILYRHYEKWLEEDGTEGKKLKWCWDIRLFRASRGYEIQDYVREHKVKNYIIIDDSSDMTWWQRRKKFVHCSQDGFLFREFKKALKLTKKLRKKAQK